MLYFKPEFRGEQSEILNVVDAEGSAVGFISSVFKENKDLYIMGQLEKEGEKQNFIDIVSAYVTGMKKSTLGDGETEPSLYIHLGGERLNLNGDKNKSDSQSGNKSENGQ
jgi:hypothetical protein